MKCTNKKKHKFELTRSYQKFPVQEKVKEETRVSN